MKIKIQETWYDIEDDKASIIHDVAISLQDLKWTRESHREAIKAIRDMRDNK